MPEAPDEALTLCFEGDDGAVLATIRTRGARLTGLAVNALEVIPADTEAARKRWSHGASLAPWPNRLCDAHWTFEGVTLQGQRNEPLGHALHGLVAEREFDVVHRDTTSVTLSCELGTDTLYPWPLRVEVSYAVHEHGITCSIGAHNPSGKRLPIALGVHPYFAFGDASTITISAAAVCETDERLIPTGMLRSPADVGITSGTPMSLSSRSLDDCFTELARDEAGLAHTVLTHANGTQVDVWQDASLGYTQVFILREFPWAHGVGHGIAIEPQTAPANALQNGTDLHWLDPQATWVVRWGVTVRAHAAS